MGHSWASGIAVPGGKPNFLGRNQVRLPLTLDPAPNPNQVRLPLTLAPAPNPNQVRLPLTLSPNPNPNPNPTPTPTPNQESTSEAVNAWYAISLLGQVVGRDDVRDMGV